ncbi:NB-ARC domain-containing protein [Streptomyces sp. NBC_00237]|uniref:ATP-binding protein n=1 Tax=Streptomyces sp. NBC_00237 TaxID=2975687 RepID=UPI00224F4B68|nr:NB-ARC domain-containing protein [Streptomyces sp. NBC_00237]MCX5205935.1 NB-ARC domain-containing protein [Streptomyces sp. NBC_00237]
MTQAGQRLGNLPTPTAALIGRHAELDELARLGRRARLVTLTGVGGVGKSRLALEAALQQQSDFTDGVWWVELAGLQEGALVAHAVAEALPLADQTTRPMLDVVAEYLAGRNLLLVLDTCEHLVDTCAMIAEVLLRSAPGLRILATSRRRLGLMVEEVVTVAPLPVPRPGQAITDSAAVTLLARRAADASPGFTVSAANAAHVAQLCRILDGLPLAIELAAARLAEIPVAELVGRLAHRFDVLHAADGSVDADPPWHRALRTAIGWSHELCTPAERLLWARLSVFAGSFDTEAAVAVCSDEHLPEEHIPALVGALVDNSLVTWQPTSDGVERFRILDTLREYGAYWLRELGEEDRLRRRHLAYYQEFARRADAAWFGPGQVELRSRATDEHDNLRTALDFALAHPQGHSALELSGNLWFFWHACGFDKEGQYYLRRALAEDTEPSPERLGALWAEALVLITLGEPREAGAHVTEMANTAARFADPEGAERARSIEALSAAMCGDIAPAVPLAQGVLDRHRCDRLTHPPLAAALVRAMAFIMDGHIDEAVAVLDHMRADCDRQGEQWMRAYGDFMCARAELARGRPAAALVHARNSWTVKRRLRDPLGMAMALDVLAVAAATDGRATDSAHLLGLAQQLWDNLGQSQVGVAEWTATRDSCEQQARLSLGDDAYTLAFRTGHRTDPNAADPLTPPSAHGSSS